MNVTNMMVGWVLMGVAGLVLFLGTIRDLLPRVRAGRLSSLATRISIRHAICRGHLVDVFFTESPTLKDVAALGAAMLAHDFQKVRGNLHAEWPRECDGCGAALRFERVPPGGGEHPVLAGMIGTVVDHA